MYWNQFQIDDEITNERMRLNAENGTIGFITELNASARQNASVAQASNGANATIVFIKDDETISDTSFFNIYLNNVDSYGNHVAFTKNDILLKKEVLQKLQLYQQYLVQKQTHIQVNLFT